MAIVMGRFEQFPPDVSIYYSLYLFVRGKAANFFHRLLYTWCDIAWTLYDSHTCCTAKDVMFMVGDNVFTALFTVDVVVRIVVLRLRLVCNMPTAPYAQVFPMLRFFFLSPAGFHIFCGKYMLIWQSKAALYVYIINSEMQHGFMYVLLWW